jgi:two-component system, OmpR family, KDP operon response regulator KdpE
VLLATNKVQEAMQLCSALEAEGRQVRQAATFDDAIVEALSGGFDLLILDAVMSSCSVCAACRAIRAHSDVGIIVINSGAQMSFADALNAGADDCMPEPILIPELLARVRAILRRMARSLDQQQIQLEDRAIDLKAHRIRGPVGREVHLTPKESLVLEHLIAHANQLLLHHSLAQAVWQRDGEGEIEFLRVVIKQLRQKLEPDPTRPRYIVTERTFGYRFQITPLKAQKVTRRRRSAPAPQSGSPAMVQ